MSKTRKIRGTGKGVVLTVWLSESVKDWLQATAARRGMKISALAREILERALEPDPDGLSN